MTTIYLIDRFVSPFLKTVLFSALVLGFTSCGERTLLNVDVSGDEQESQSEDPEFSFLGGRLHYDKNSNSLILSSWINDRLNSKSNYYEYVVDLTTDSFVLLKNQTVTEGGQFVCVRKSAGLCVELKVEFPGLDKMVSAKLGSVEIEQTESGIKTVTPVFSILWPRISWKNNDLPWIHYVQLDPNPIGYLDLPNFNSESFYVLPGQLDYDVQFYNSTCKTTMQTVSNFEANCDYFEKMTNLKTQRKWIIQFTF